MNRTARPEIEDIERRRSELLGVTFFVLVGLALLSVLLSFVDESAAWMAFVGGGLNVVRVCLVGLTITFAWYVRQQQFRLRQMAIDLVNERVVSAALESRLREATAMTDTGHVALESSLATILRTVSMLARDAESLSGEDREALRTIEERVGALSATAQDPFTAPHRS